MSKKIGAFICTPFAGADEAEMERNLEFTRKVCRRVLEAGAVPFAPHLHFPAFLDEAKPEERQAGIEAGIEIMRRFDVVVLGIPSWRSGLSRGMTAENESAIELGKPRLLFRDYPLGFEGVRDAPSFEEVLKMITARTRGRG